MGPPIGHEAEQPYAAEMALVKVSVLFRKKGGAMDTI